MTNLNNESSGSITAVTSQATNKPRPLLGHEPLLDWSAQDLLVFQDEIRWDSDSVVDSVVEDDDEPEETVDLDWPVRSYESVVPG